MTRPELTWDDHTTDDTGPGISSQLNSLPLANGDCHNKQQNAF